MAELLVEHYRRLFRYERECVGHVVASLESIPTERRQEALYARAIGLVAHLRVALLLWLARLGAATPPAHPFPSPQALDQEADGWLDAIAQWEQYLSQCHDSDLQQTVHYHTTAGVPYENTLGDILQHLFGHGLYHRGQIALIVRQLGGTPAVTDFIVWARQQHSTLPT